MRWTPSVVVAATSSTLAVFINIATELRNSWWPWIGVIILTLISAFLAYRTEKRRQGSSPPMEIRNHIMGDVAGDAVQANDIRGDVTFGNKRINQEGPGPKTVKNYPPEA